MGVYVVTGCASGMGRSTADTLRWNGHRVIGVDLHDADINADLSTEEGIQKAIDGIKERCGGRLEGAVMAAGLGPIPGREELIAKVNYRGVIGLLEGIHDELAAAGNAKVVVFSSNSTTTVPGINLDILHAFETNDVDKVLEIARKQPDRAATQAYAGSKLALAHWVREQAVLPRWAGKGIRVNAIAPGAILTPMLQKSLLDPATAEATKNLPVPIGEFGKPEEVAQWILFMLSPAANFLCGAVIFLDGGTDAYFRAKSFPSPFPADGLEEYIEKSKAWVQQRKENENK